MNVEIWDDGSKDGLYDLAVSHEGKPIAAVEVVGDVDSIAAETWNLVNGRGDTWTDSRLIGGWLVWIEPETRIRRLSNELPTLLVLLENGVSFEAVEDDLAELGVVSAYQSSTSVPGSIYVTFSLRTERSGGAVPLDGESVSVWVADFLNDSGRRDVLAKLERAPQPEKHVFVLVSAVPTAPWPVPYVLSVDPVLLPTSVPSLPAPVTHLWVASTWDTKTGLHWNNRTWARFNKIE